MMGGRARSFDDRRRDGEQAAPRARARAAFLQLSDSIRIRSASFQNP